MKIDDSTAKKIRKDFPILKKVIYLDNAATTQKPNCVIRKIAQHYKKNNANIHRGLYKLSAKATGDYENARIKVAKFINADPDEIVFVRGATEGLNLLSYTISTIFSNRKEILLTELEHHANIVPWQELSKREHLTIRYVKIKKGYTLDMDDLRNKLTAKTAMFAFTMISNSLGTINDAKLLCKMAKKRGVLTVVDAAQGASHSKIDVKDIGCDFLVFSGHKVLGPSGIGVLYGKREYLTELAPFNFGGDMISEVSYEGSTYKEAPEKFEAGTPNIEGAIGLGEAVTYLENIGMENISAWEQGLVEYAKKQLSGIKQVELYSPKKSAGIISFNIKGIHAHDVAGLLDDYSICVRAGHHCTMPLMDKLGIAGTVRASFYVYNTREDVDKLVDAIKKIIKMFKV